MIITKLFTGADGRSYFEDVNCGHETAQPLGLYPAPKD